MTQVCSSVPCRTLLGAVAYTGEAYNRLESDAMNWSASYLSASKEVHPEKMPGRIAAAREAINERLVAWALNVLETELRSW